MKDAGSHIQFVLLVKTGLLSISILRGVYHEYLFAVCSFPE